MKTNLFKDLDLFIRFTDDMHNKYVVDNFNYTYHLIITFEDWTRIYGDGRPHVKYIAEYVTPHHLSPRVKWQSEDLDELIVKVREWNECHRENELARNY